MRHDGESSDLNFVNATERTFSKTFYFEDVSVGQYLSDVLEFCRRWANASYTHETYAECILYFSEVVKSQQ